MDLPKRKSPRLKDFDYSTPGYYFITICTKDKKKILSNIKSQNDVGAVIGRPPEIILTKYGLLAESAIKNITNHYPMVGVDKFVIMPNHIHMILIIHPDENGRPMTAPTISQIINQTKGYVTKQASTPLWQRSFHDHIIRSEKDYRKICEYIDQNPANWEKDCFFV